jgi:hypothetical protein
MELKLTLAVLLIATIQLLSHFGARAKRPAKPSDDTQA